MKRIAFLAGLALATAPVLARAQGGAALPAGAIGFQRINVRPFGWLNAPIFPTVPQGYWNTPVFIINGSSGGVVKSNFGSTDWDVIEESAHFTTFSGDDYYLVAWVQNGVLYLGWETKPFGFIQNVYLTPLQYHHLPQPPAKKKQAPDPL